ncbi:MAG: hypothetical protein AB8F26_06605 [Phycisphaerales bacterium]
MLARFIQRQIRDRIENLPEDSPARRSAEQWVIECPLCGHAAPALERGITRIHAASKGKRIRACCSHCDRLTLARFYKDEIKARALRTAPDLQRATT